MRDVLIEDLENFEGQFGAVRSLDDLKRIVDKFHGTGRPVAFDVETGYSGPNYRKRSLDVVPRPVRRRLLPRPTP
jgi:hypothetical protein